MQVKSRAIARSETQSQRPFEGMLAREKSNSGKQNSDNQKKDARQTFGAEARKLVPGDKRGTLFAEKLSPKEFRSLEKLSIREALEGAVKGVAKMAARAGATASAAMQNPDKAGGAAPDKSTRLEPPSATGSYRLGDNSFGAKFLNFKGFGTATIIGRDVSLIFGLIKSEAGGAILGERGAGTVGGRPVSEGAGFRLGVAPNDAGYMLEVRQNGERATALAMDSSALPLELPRGEQTPVIPPMGFGVAWSTPSHAGNLLFVYRLSDNVFGARQVTLNRDGTGMITGENIEITLEEGGYDDSGSWVAKSGSGIVNGETVTLIANELGNVFEAPGAGGIADRIITSIDGVALEAEVIAVAQ